ncbi:MAG: pantetheine-phosphate adenylyltransferase [Chloroflexi bacterium]|nr:pantetheine-phosphate adenylyltransferase [Chloroflexota bacterium]
MTIAVYPATFDPIHNGHIDIAVRAARIFDVVIAAAYARPSKNVMFSVAERLELLRQAFKGMRNIQVASYDTLTVDFARDRNATVIIRGLRDVSDFELEFKQALMYRHLMPDVDVVNFITNSDYGYVSSSLLKEVAMLGGNIDQLVPPHVAIAMRDKLRAMDVEARAQVKMVALSND